MTRRRSAGPLFRAAAIVVVPTTLVAGLAAQAPTAPRPPVDENAPFQCWWRSDAGGIRLGEIVEVSLTCAALERDDLRAVPDESRLTVAAIQMAPFEIVGGSHPPDLRAGDRRFFEYRYQLRIIDPDVIGRDVKLPPLSIPYRVESRVGAGSTLAGRDLVHLMPQLMFRVVSQVPADATDIRDSADAGLARVDALRFRASAFRVAALVLTALAAVLAISAVPALLRRLRGGQRRAAAQVSEAAILRTVAARLTAILDAHPTGDLTAEAAAEAQQLVRIVAGLAARAGVRQAPLGRGAAVPEGRIAVTGWLGRTRAAVTSSATSDAVGRALAALPASAAAGDRTRLESLGDGLAQLTRRQYGASADADTTAVVDVLKQARDAASELARARRWQWSRAAATPSPLIQDS
jgi:hypothetical protein